MRFLMKFRRKKGEIVPIVSYLHDLMLGKCYPFSMLKFYTNLCSNKAFIYIQNYSIICEHSTTDMSRKIQVNFSRLCYMIQPYLYCSFVTFVTIRPFFAAKPLDYSNEHLKIVLINISTLQSITRVLFFAFEVFLKISTICQNRGKNALNCLIRSIICDTFSNFLRTSQNNFYQCKHTLQYHQSGIFCI